MADDIAELRERAERGDPLTQVEVARLLGLRRQTVHAIERRALAKLRVSLARADGGDTPPGMARRKQQREPVQHPARPEGRYRQQFGVIVICKDEAEQRTVYEQLRERGLRIRVVVT